MPSSVRSLALTVTKTKTILVSEKITDDVCRTSQRLAFDNDSLVTRYLVATCHATGRSTVLGRAATADDDDDDDDDEPNLTSVSRQCGRRKPPDAQDAPMPCHRL